MDWKQDLRELHSLREQGILTEEEFDEEKSRVLASKNKSVKDPLIESLPSFKSKSSEASKFSHTYQQIEITRSERNLVTRALIIYGLGGFISIFLKWFDLPGDENDFVPKNFDYGVVLTLFDWILFPAIAISLLYFRSSRESDSQLVGFLTPYLIVELVPNFWAILQVFLISPMRAPIGASEFYGRLGPGIYLVSTTSFFSLLAIAIWIKRHIEKQEFDFGDDLRRESSIVVPVVVLATIGALYGTLKPNPGLDDDFGPFTSTYKVNWEAWMGDGVIEPILLIAASIIVAKFANPTIREAGVLSLLFILVSSVFYTIALNAETEEMRVWAFGGTMLVLATVILAFTLLSKFALKKVEDI